MNPLLLYRTIGLLTTLLSRRAAYAIALPVSAAAYRNHHTIRETLLTNLRVVIEGRGAPCDESALERIAHRNFYNFAKYLVDFFKMTRLDVEEFRTILQVECIEYLEQCREMKKGIIGLTAHVGNWELGAIALENHRCQVNAIVRPQPSAKLDAVFLAKRAKRGIRCLPLSGGVRAAQACLKRDEFVVLLADMVYSERGRRVPLFGKPAHIPRAPAVLAARSGAPILPGFVLREADDTFRFRLYPPIVSLGTESSQVIQERVCAVLEAVIGEHPDQWFAFHPVWDPGASRQPR